MRARTEAVPRGQITEQRTVAIQHRGRPDGAGGDDQRIAAAGSGQITSGTGFFRPRSRETFGRKARLRLRSARFFRHHTRVGQGEAEGMKETITRKVVCVHAPPDFLTP